MDTQTLHKQLCDTVGNSPPLALSHIRISGADAQDFLQGQLTLDLNQLAAGHHQLTAWCNAKGRVWCLLRIWRSDDGFALLVPQNQADAFIKRLRMFVLRAKVNIDASDSVCRAHIGQQPSAQAGQLECQGAHTVLHHDVHHRLTLVSPDDQDGGDDSPDVSQHYIALRILAGEAQIDATNQEKFLPQSIGLGELGGLHFNKGCYVGQEIVARVHYRGKAPQRLNCGLDLSAEERSGKSLLTAVETAQGELLQWVENIKAVE